MASDEGPRHSWPARLIRRSDHRNLDQHGGRWWWPADPSSPSRNGMWRAFLADATRPATFSTPHLRIVRERIAHQEGISNYVSRSAALLAIAIALAMLGSSWWVWIFLLPGAIQCVLEIVLYPSVCLGEPSPRFLRPLTAIARNHFEIKDINVTGLIGSLACITNFIAIAFFAPSGGALGWMRVGALALAVLYINSGLAGPLMDGSMYTEKNVNAALVHQARPYIAVVLLVVEEGFVLISVLLGRWEPGLAPIAFLVPGLALGLHHTIRTHDRVLDAVIPVLREAVVDARTDLASLTHDDFQEYKDAVTRVAMEQREPTFTESALMLQLPGVIRHLRDRADPDAQTTMEIPLAELPEQIRRSAAGTAPFPISLQADVKWGQETRHTELLARDLITGLVWNAVQAVSRQDDPTASHIELALWSEGEGRERTHHLSVHDPLEEVSDDVIRASKSLSAVRTHILAEDGTFEQKTIPGIPGKSFTVVWPDYQAAKPLSVETF